jgi:hypothetical protein
VAFKRSKIKWDALPDKVKKGIDELAFEMAIRTGQYHDKQNGGGAIAWAKREYSLLYVSGDDS